MPKLTSDEPTELDIPAELVPPELEPQFLQSAEPIELDPIAELEPPELEPQFLHLGNILPEVPRFSAPQLEPELLHPPDPDASPTL